MTKSKYTNFICILTTIATLLGSAGLLAAYAASRDKTDSATSGTEMAYETGLFDDSIVHTLDIVIDQDDWADLLENAMSEEYYPCDLILDGSAVQNVALRTKGNTSLNQVSSYGNNRYSFKIEFDHYQAGKTYGGLDKLALNNLILDNTCMKDYLCYKMMAAMGAEAPLCSFLSVTVNGENWGLYLAVEGVEESFAQRNYGSEPGQIYKPDFEESEGMGGNSDALKLQYTDDNPSSYEEIFDTAKFDLTSEQQEALIQALKTLDSGENLEDALDVDEIIRYFVVHNFVLNGDSYTGSMLHNYYLHERNGILSLVAWDYNLAFGSFSSGDSATSLVNYPIDDPLLSSSMEERPMIAWIFESEEYTALYHQYFAEFLSTCFDSGWFTETFETAYSLIEPYVKADENGFVSYDGFVTACDTLQSFITLRAQSIQGQLDGVIPSTAEGQSADSSALLDAGDLSISDMGSNTGGSETGRGQLQSSGNAFDPRQSGTTTVRTSVDLLAVSDDTVQPQSDTRLPFGNGDSSSNSSQPTLPPDGAMGQLPADSSDSAASSANGNTVNGQKPDRSFDQTGNGKGGVPADNLQGNGDVLRILLLSGSSVLLLIVALILICRYKRRRF